MPKKTAQLQPPPTGVTIRMYRQGHGDCFVLAFPGTDGGDPVYVLIDCGLKPGSQNFLDNKPKIGDVVQHLQGATGGQLDLAVITHEHQDHLNGIWKRNSPYFENITIKEAWLAWTENPTDPHANELRQRHHDQLLTLTEARLQLNAAGDEKLLPRLDSLLSLELGADVRRNDPRSLLAAASDPAKSTNKQALKLIKDKANQERGIQYLEPGGTPHPLPGTGVLVYVLGPPRDESLLRDEDPIGDESFPQGHSFAAATHTLTARATGAQAPFRHEFQIAPQSAFALLPEGQASFFTTRYGQPESHDEESTDKEVPPDAAWRRIDTDWLHSAEQLALALNTGINNTSLVLVFELPNTKKTLLFAGDAQRGNWLSWHQTTWDDGDTEKVRALLARSVLYKVGHHASHNATLNGTRDSPYANLSWMGHGEAANEFTAMITAVEQWALTKNDPPWRHPLPAIRTALLEKTHGRVLQTDTPPTRPNSVPISTWDKFSERTTIDPLYYDLTIHDEQR